MNDPKTNLKDAATIFVRQLLKLKRDEKLFVYGDQRSDPALANAIEDAAHETKAHAVRFELQSDLKLTDMVKALADKIEEGMFDVICELSEQYFYPTRAWKRALRTGSRIYSLAGMNADAFIRCVGNVDHEAMLDFGMGLKGLCERSTCMHIVSRRGTNLTLRINSDSRMFRLMSMLRTRRKPYVLYPVDPGGSGRAAFLDGQLAFQGFPETINGTAVIDGYFWPPRDVGRLDTPVTVIIKKGKVIALDSAASQATVINRWFDGKNKDIRHFCIGFNPGAALTGKVMEAERVFGCFSLGIGKFPFHADGVIKNPSLHLDNECIEKNGLFIHTALSKRAEKLLREGRRYGGNESEVLTYRGKSCQHFSS